MDFGFEKQHVLLPSFFSVNSNPELKAEASLNVAMQNDALECLVINFQEEVHLLSEVLVWRVSVNEHRKTFKVFKCSCLQLSDSLACLAFIFH